MTQGDRRLVAIMYTDMVGYTALGQRDESLSLALVEEQRKVVRPALSRHNGREVKTMGDAFLVEFPNATEAVRCAYDVQRSVREFNLSLPSQSRIHLRIGIHVGEVVEDEGDIFGDAVNVASRIEPLSEDGGVCVTRQVQDFVRNKVDVPLSSLGLKSLKGVAEPMEVYRMVMPWEREASRSSVRVEKKNRVAVLPFTSMSPDPNDEYFADGMTEELIDRLAHVKGIEVIARTSVMSYKKKEKKAGEIAKELLVGSLVEGSVRKAGSKVRVTAQLVDGVTEGHMWSEHYDRSLDDVFAVQSEIAEKVAGELRVQLLQSEKRRIERRPTENMEGYDAFLRGRELLREGSEHSLRQALELFEGAIDLDPSFARAHVGVADCHQFLGNFGYEPWEVMLSAMNASLTRALELDPDLAEAHAAQAALHFFNDDNLGAEAEARRALELNPSLPEAYHKLYEVAGIRGEPEEMVRNIETAYRLDPIRPFYTSQVGYAYLVAGKEQEAVEHWRKTEHLDPAGTYRSMAHFCLSKGDIAQAREFLAKLEKLQPTNPLVTYIGGFIDATAGEREKAMESVRKIEERNMGPVAYNYVAFIYHALGDLDRYFANLNRALEEHTLDALFVMYSPILARGREDPRYRELVEKLRRETGLTK